ncbi:MAG: hypothetical protein RBT33_00760 [Candidatus Dojkabacteria bacterium]|jgi:hypothetical protein|nr:hypothetical protein [Candidatus Dojkabacteria bacterium]
MGTPEDKGLPSADGMFPEDTDSQNNSESTENTEQPVVDWEKRYKDLQSHTTKVTQDNKALRVENEVLKTGTSLVISDEQKQELENLKFSDPDAWREKLNKIEAESHKEIAKTINQKTELESRIELRDEFLKTNSGITIDMLEYDVPVKLARELAEDKITYAEFLDKAKGFLSKGRKLKTPESTLDQPNLSKQNGDHSPSVGDEGKRRKSSDDYKKEIY